MEENLFNTAGVEDPMDLDFFISVLESILFAAGDAVKKKDLARIMKIRMEDLDSVITAYEEELNRSKRGIRLLVLETNCSLAQKKLTHHI